MPLFAEVIWQEEGQKRMDAQTVTIVAEIVFNLFTAHYCVHLHEPIPTAYKSGYFLFLLKQVH